MKIQYMSDLHMELWDNSRYLKMNEFEAIGDILVLAGDTFYLRNTTPPQKRFWDWASENFRQVLLVPGNHEYYSNEPKAKEFFKDAGIHLLIDSTTVIDNTITITKCRCW